jgi:hypothetical protein
MTEELQDILAGLEMEPGVYIIPTNKWGEYTGALSPFTVKEITEAIATFSKKKHLTVYSVKAELSTEMITHWYGWEIMSLKTPSLRVVDLLGYDSKCILEFRVEKMTY